MTTYSWIKVFHLTFIALWMGGMMANSLVLVAVPGGGPPAASTAMRRWDRYVTTPAMILTWAAGITLAVWGEWYMERWLWAKVALVLALTALHGAQSAALRRQAAGRHAAKWLEFSPLAIVGALPIIAMLAVGKPF